MRGRVQEIRGRVEGALSDERRVDVGKEVESQGRRRSDDEWLMTVEGSLRFRDSLGWFRIQ